MKRLFLLVALIIPIVAPAQNAWDAFRYSHLNYQGTARSMALGNAVTALGGDFGSITINPAGSAIYPYSEIAITPSLANSFSDVTYLGQQTSDRYSKIGLSHFGYVGSLRSNGRSVSRITFAVGYNKVQDFTSRTSVHLNNSTSSWLSSVATMTNGIPSADLEKSDDYNPYFDSNASWRSILAWDTYLLDLLPDTTDEYIGATENLDGYQISVGGPLDQRFIKESKGSMGEYLFNMGFGMGERLFAGINLTFQNVFYNTYEKFQETAKDYTQFQTGFQSFAHTYNQLTTGIGFNIKAGIIALPTDNLRLGFSVSTPTWTSLSDEWQESMTAEFNSGNSSSRSPAGNYSYSVRTPMRFQAGIAYTFGSFGFISFDYEGVDYRTMKMASREDNWAFDDENEAIRYGSDNYHFRYANNFRVGAEVRLSPVSLRAGYNLYGKPEDSYSPTQVISAGIGFRSDGFFMDLGAAYRLAESEFFTLYDDQLSGMNDLSNLKILLTIGLRF